MIQEIKHEENDFICPICLEYIVQSVSTKCGHTFCEICIDEYLLFFKVISLNYHYNNQECPICDQCIRKSKLAYCYLLDSLILNFIKDHHPEQLHTYELNKEKNKQWKLGRQLPNLEVGMKIDIRDPNNVWKVGIIKRLKFQKDNQRTKYVTVHYEGKSDKNDEELPDSSPRLASFEFYTGRKDIPKYSNSKNPFLKQLLVVEQLNEQQQFFLSDESSLSD